MSALQQPQQRQYIAVDWGTSSFRLWLVGQGGAVLGESRSHEGMTTARDIGFSAVLESHIARVNAPDGAPVIMCGMVGAKQGWLDAGYVDLPAKPEDIAARAVRVPGHWRDVRVLPGLAQRDANSADVMRGEETQLLGVPGGTAADCLVAMPGTHSKWVRVAGGEVKSFSTFMTGELFSLISRNSILQHTIREPQGFEPTAPAFLEALRAAYRQPSLTTNRLFSIRASDLLFGASGSASDAVLSGTMIGLEFAGALENAGAGGGITLVASGRLKDIYEAALKALELPFQTVDADDAVRRGLDFAARNIWALGGARSI